ncbi:uncharacterized protein LOC142831111 isoform X2 [Pelodiscus sinensis]|uniref:uncharacterized protein LOC142831111 isoform X2 n=1 Tax=Pelodiscus sinensis TaxID=13735 RepID=UPI003F6AE875
MESRRLPVEVITYILSFLPLADRKEASLVNRTWYFAARDSLRQPETLRQAQRALTHLQELDLAGLRHLSDLSFNRLTSCTPSLARLSLARCHLAFEWDPSRGAHSSPALLSFRNLLRFLKEQAGSLRALDLSGTSLTSPALGSLVRVGGLRLQELTLQHCGDLSDEAVGLLCTHQPQLTALDLTGCAELCDRAALALSTGLPALRSLRLGKLPRLTDGAFLRVAELRSLRSLDVAECSRVSGRELVKACSSPERRPPLASLSFAFCSLLTDSAVLSLARSLSGSLRALDLSSCISITDASLRAVSSHLPRLTVLRLAWCKELTDGGLLGVEEPRENLKPEPTACSDSTWTQAPQQPRASLAALWQLQELDLTACSKLTDTSITQVIRFPALRRLSLGLLPELTDASLGAVAGGCPSLEQLSMSHCGRLTDAGFVAAASSLRRLQDLALAGCSQLTGRTLAALGRECRQLKSLDVSMCHGISMADIECFQAHSPLQPGVQSRFVGGADLSFTL